MSFLAIDGPFVGRTIAYLPRGYHCVMMFDNHPDILSCHPEFMREQLVAVMRDGLESFTDTATSLVAVNAMRHGSLNTLAIHVLSLIVDANEAIWGAQLEARSYGKSKG